MSTDKLSSINIFDPKNILSLLQIAALIVTLVWIFAFMKAQIDRHANSIERHEVILESHANKLQSQEVQQAITNTQYDQIMKKLDEINEKINRE